MDGRRRCLMVVCCGSVLLATSGGLIVSAHAQLGQFGGIAGALMGHLGAPHFNGSRGCGSRCRGNQSRDDNSNTDNSSRSSDRTRNATTLAAPPSNVENALLRTVAQLNPDEVGASSENDGTNKSLSSSLGKAALKETERDWTEAVQKIINRFTANQDKRVTSPGDVTEHAIEQSLDSAIKNAKLDTFESFLGENWTVDRLRLMVLDRVSDELDSLFKGNTRGYAPMQEVDNLIQHSAQAIYRRIFELSELLAANRSSALFVQRLYQTHGAHAKEGLREDVNDMIMQAANAAMSKYEAAFRQNDNGYALRYRGKRIVFDCLSDNVDKISSSETDIAEKGEIAQRVNGTSTTECATWLQNQFGTDIHAIKPQKPVPLRVVWSGAGPRDDPSMYGQTTNELQ